MYGKYVLTAHTHAHSHSQAHKYFIKYVLCPIYDVFVTLHGHKYGKKNILMMRLLAGGKYLANEAIRHLWRKFLISKFNSNNDPGSQLVFDMCRSSMLISRSRRIGMHIGISGSLAAPPLTSYAGQPASRPISRPGDDGCGIRTWADSQLHWSPANEVGSDPRLISVALTALGLRVLAQSFAS